MLKIEKTMWKFHCCILLFIIMFVTNIYFFFDTSSLKEKIADQNASIENAIVQLKEYECECKMLDYIIKVKPSMTVYDYVGLLGTTCWKGKSEQIGKEKLPV